MAPFSFVCALSLLLEEKVDCEARRMRCPGLAYAEIYCCNVGDFARCDGRPRSSASWNSCEQ